MTLAFFHSLSPATRALFWAVSAGLLFSVLNTLMRALTLVLDPFQTQFLRYLAGLAVMMPLVLREPFVADRWLAALVGFAGVLIVVYPKLSAADGIWSLAMLVSSPLFAASFLITKALTRRDTSAVIVVWQSLTVSLFTLPFALFNWQWPSPAQWGLFLICGVLGSAGHWSLTNAYRLADISATQGVRFLDLVWAALLGYLVFDDHPSASTLAGGLVIFGATVWIARREARR